MMADISKIMEQAVEAGQVGAVSLSLKTLVGESLDMAAGLADPKAGTAASPDTMFHIGSVTKSLTAELVHEQIARGRIALDTPITLAAPEMQRIGSLANHKVTIADLLSHRSGIDGDILFEAGEDDRVLRRFVSRIDTLDLLFEPGAGFSYANVGYGLLGRIVEGLACQAYRPLMEQHLRECHGLSQFAFRPQDKASKPRAIAYQGDAPEPLSEYSNLASGTALAMSMGDLASWGMGQLGNRTMSQPAIITPLAQRYYAWGHGFMIFSAPGETPVFGHDGGTAGTATFLRILPEAQAVWAFSVTGPGGLTLYRQVEPLLFGHCGQSAPANQVPGGSEAPTDLAPYAGHYARYKMSFDLTLEGDALRLNVGGDYAASILDSAILRPLTDQVFVASLPAAGGAEIWAGFADFDSDGRPRRLQMIERAAVRL